MRFLRLLWRGWMIVMTIGVIAVTILGDVILVLSPGGTAWWARLAFVGNTTFAGFIWLTKFTEWIDRKAAARQRFDRSP